MYMRPRQVYCWTGLNAPPRLIDFAIDKQKIDICLYCYHMASSGVSAIGSPDLLVIVLSTNRNSSDVHELFNQPVVFRFWSLETV